MAQKIFVVREMMPKDIRREFLTGPRKFDEIMEKLEIIVIEMVADDGPVPMDLGNVGMHVGKSSQNDSDASNDMSHEEVCTIAWKVYKAGKGAGRKGPVGSGTWHRGKGGDERPSRKRDDGGKKGGKNGSKGGKPEWYGDKDKEGTGGKGKGKGQGKSENAILLRLRRARTHRSELSVQLGQQHGRRWTKKMTKVHIGNVNLRRRNQMSLRVWRHPTTKESGADRRRTEPPGGERGLIHSQHSTTSPKTMMTSRRQED